MSKQGTTPKHAGTTKHNRTPKGKAGKHNPKTQPAHQTKAQHQASLKNLAKARQAQAKQRAQAKQMPLAQGVACCAAEALAADLRLNGWKVTDGDVYRLYQIVAANDDCGASLQDTLAVAMWAGLAGIRLKAFWKARPTASRYALGLVSPAHAILIDGEDRWSWGIRIPDLWPNAPTDEAWEMRWAL